MLNKKNAAMFDNIADIYDKYFTYSSIGAAQRSIVHRYMDSALKASRKFNILELNCGTGEDAIYLAEKGNHVTATDLSAEMIRITETKIANKQLKELISARTMDIRELEGVFDIQFDMVFSNFGGLNCISLFELINLSESLSKMIKPGGRFIAVIMPEYSIWEILYFTIKRKRSSIFRRSSGKALIVNIFGSEVNTRYYSPARISAIFSRHFKTVSLIPVGFFLPPSFMEPHFKKRNKLIDFFLRLENMAGNFPCLASFSDHYLIDFEKIDK